MNHGEVTGWSLASGQLLRWCWRDGRFTRITSVTEPGDAGPLWVAPALCDLQINGYAGVDFQRDGVGEDDLLRAAVGLREAGCASFLLTLITDEWPRLLGRLRNLRRLRAVSPELQRAIVGWHVEGPFLSAEPGYRGAHDPLVMCDPTPAHVRELRAAAGEDPVLLTLDPARRGALAAIAEAVGLGMKVSLGHTNASSVVLKQALAAGATGFTHLGNGCPRELDRQDNILWRVLDLEGINVSLICDGIHVAPELFRLIHRVRAGRQIYYTTDAMSAAGSPPGRYRLGRLELEVGGDGVVRLPGTGNFAGSALRPDCGVARAAAMLAEPWREAWARLSLAPRRFLGLPDPLVVGQPATFCLLDESAACWRMVVEGEWMAPRLLDAGAS
ncbi:MAG TPA: N-acetylglucosamine-6-phosphate deacetylase [Methylomirabilota bacterium]|nr:N-acetylglucosamine-6-phosphate deacetylase [Methylomirabilota bacterium]